jgi:nitrous oxidase accessory protein NosD
VQNEITELSSKGLLPYQHKTTGSISLVNGTRTYDLASDFVQLWGQDPFFYDATSNYQIRAYRAARMRYGEHLHLSHAVRLPDFVLLRARHRTAGVVLSGARLGRERPRFDL